MDRLNESCDPMDVDVSGHSVKPMDISYGETTDLLGETMMTDLKPDCSIRVAADDSSNPNITTSCSLHAPVNQELKKYHIQKPVRNDKLKWYLKVMFPLIVIIISILIYQVNTIQCSGDLNLKDFSETLSGNIFGQSHAINMFLQTLELTSKSKIIFFYGGTGVGKTLVSSLLLESIGPFTNVYHYTMPSFKNTFSTEFMLGVTLCKSSVLIVDDLTANDFNVKEQIRDVILKSENLENVITVILIFNCQESTKDYCRKCDETFETKLLANFAEIKVLKKFIKFEHLTQNELRKCVQQELGERHLSTNEFNDILKNFNVTIDGCKGVHSKMKYLKIA